ncbi:hypothetical protein AAC387_Pa06g0010 [Persea americana]
MRAAVKQQLPLFILPEWRKTGKCEFTDHAGCGKAAAEENWNIDFTADESSGKAAIASFTPLTEEETGKLPLPPMGVAVKLQLQVFLLCERRKTGKSTFRL